MPERPAPGRAVVTRRAVTDIVRTAVLGSYGVAGFATPDPWGHIVRRLGLGEPGIWLDLEDLAIDLHLRVAYGLPIAEVARQVESAVRYAIGRDLGREPSAVTIHVDELVEREPGVGLSPDARSAPGPSSTTRRSAVPTGAPAVDSVDSEDPVDSPGPTLETDAAEPGARR